MKLFCSIFLIYIGVIGIGLQFIAVSILGIGLMEFIDAVYSFGLAWPFGFCVGLILAGVVFSLINLVKAISRKQ